MNNIKEVDNSLKKRLADTEDFSLNIRVDLDNTKKFLDTSISNQNEELKTLIKNTEKEMQERITDNMDKQNGEVHLRLGELSNQIELTHDKLKREKLEIDEHFRNIGQSISSLKADSQQLLSSKITELEDAVAHNIRLKVSEMNERFETVEEKQKNDKNETDKQIQLIEQNQTQSDLNTKEQFCDTLNKVNTKFKSERKRLEDDFSSLEKQLDNMDNFAMETRKRLGKQEEYLKNVEVDMQDKVMNISAVMDNMQDKIYEFETNKKNNLIFYGVPSEERETGDRLLMKIQDIIRSNLNISREGLVSYANRMYTGPEVLGCRPVLVSFHNFKDREEVLQNSKFLKTSCLSVTEDLSKKTRESRQELR